MADDAESPQRKVMEMDEGDGFMVIQEYFGGSIEMFLESLWVTDRIFIRGLNLRGEGEGGKEEEEEDDDEEEDANYRRYMRATAYRTSSGNFLANHSEIIEQPEQESAAELSTSSLLPFNYHIRRAKTDKRTG